MGVEFVRDVPDTYGPRTRDLSFPFIALLHQGLMVEPSFISTQKGLTRFLEQYKGQNITVYTSEKFGYVQWR